MQAEAAGLADLSNHVSMTPGSVFNTGSVAKSVIGHLARRAVHNGDWTLEEYIDRFLPVPASWRGRLTLESLLRHRSGIWDYRSILQLLGRGASDTVTTSDVCRLIFRQPLTSLPITPDPGYSNSNYLLLGLALESLYGKPLTIQVAERAGELGLDLQLVRSPRTIIPKLARGYERRGNGELCEHRFWVDGCGASNLFASAAELTAWGLVLAEDDEDSPTINGYHYGRFKIGSRWLVVAGDDGGCVTAMAIDMHTRSVAAIGAVAADVNVTRICVEAVGAAMPAAGVGPESPAASGLVSATASSVVSGRYHSGELDHTIGVDCHGTDELLLNNAGALTLLKRFGPDCYTDGHVSVRAGETGLLVSVNHAANIPFFPVAADEL